MLITCGILKLAEMTASVGILVAVAWGLLRGVDKIYVPMLFVWAFLGFGTLHLITWMVTRMVARK